MIWEI